MFAYSLGIRSKLVEKNPSKCVVASRGRADRLGGRQFERVREHDLNYRPPTFTQHFWGRLGLCSGVKVTVLLPAETFTKTEPNLFQL